MPKTKERTPIQIAREEGFTDGFNFGMEMGRLSIFKKQLNIKNSTWSVNYLNGNEFKLDLKEMSDYLIEEDSDKSIKIIYEYEYCDIDNHLKTDYLIGKAKNRTIGEIWKAIDKIMSKHREDVFGDHKFIESLIYKDNQIQFYTGS
jgi:hypothetical protein